MRKTLLGALLLFPLAGLSQVTAPSITLVQSAPSGSCTNNLPDRQVAATGLLYSCQSGTWTLVGAGAGGPPSGAAGGALGGTYPNPTLALGTTLTYASTLNTNAALGSVFRVTLTGNVTLAAPTGMYDGQRAIWEFIQDGTGSRTVTLPSVFKFGTDVTGFTATTTAGLADYVGAVYNAGTSNWSVVAVSHGYTP